MSTQFENYSVSEINFIEPVDNDLGNLGVYSLTLTPDSGYELDANNFALTTPVPAGITNYSFNQAGPNVRFDFGFANGTIMPNNDIEFPLCIQGFADLLGFIIQGTVDIKTTNATPLSQIGPYSGSGEFGSTEVVYAETITANSNHYFFTEPIASLAVGDSTAYNITSSKTYGGPNGELTSITFSVEYTYPAENVSNDLITIVADAIPVVVTTQLINAFNFNGASGYSFVVNSSGEVRDLNLIGDPNAIYSVSLFDDLGNETVLATNQVMGSSGTATIPGITIPSYDAGNPPYELIISGQINSTIANVGSTVVIDIVQQEPVFIEVTATSTDSNLSISGIPDTLNLNANIDYVPGSFPTLNFSFEATSSGTEIVELAPVTANSFTPAIPDPASPAYNYVLNNLTSALNSSNDVFTVSGTIEVYSSGATPITHTLNLDNHIATIVLPTIVTTSVSNISGSTATSGGESITDGGGSISSKGIQWSEFADFNTILGANNEGSGTASFSSIITGLASGNTYYVRAYAQNEVGIAYGQVESFQSSATPTISTVAVSGISWDVATSGGENISDNGSSIVSKGVQWSTSSSFATIEGSTNDGSGTANFVSNLTGLTETTTYYVRAYATNGVGTGYGQTETFQTIALPVTGLSWVTTVNNPCNSTPWTITNNNSKIRYDIENSSNCGGTCADTQSGTATATITVGGSAVDMGLDFEGIGELESPNFEKIEFELDSVQVARAQAAGGNQGCAMGPVVKTFVQAPPYRLNANTSYTFFINFTTNDAAFHNGAYYEVDLSFTNVP